MARNVTERPSPSWRILAHQRTDDLHDLVAGDAENRGAEEALGLGVHEVIPVADVDRAKEFYARLGWRLDADLTADNGFRGVQFTPPGSPASIQFGTNMSSAAPGSAQGLYLVVSDVEAARGDLAARGAAVSEVFHASKSGAQFQPDGATGRVIGHVAAPRPDLRRDDLRIAGGLGERAPASGGRPRRARAAHRPAGRGVAGLVRRLHGGGASRHGAADVSEHVAASTQPVGLERECM
jgi:predicted enzyme related to lactoylglutathione lyase